MNWLSIAANLLRDAMNSPEESEPPAQEGPPPSDVSGLIGLLNQHRSEIDTNFEAVAGMLNAQNERHLKAMQIQRRWNYSLAAALALVAIVLIASYFRG
jgi:hypothetical protein